MLFPRLAIAITALLAVLLLLIAPNLLLSHHSVRSVASLPGECAGVTGPDGSGWGGATVCTPWGADPATTTQSGA